MKGFFKMKCREPLRGQQHLRNPIEDTEVAVYTKGISIIICNRCDGN